MSTIKYLDGKTFRDDGYLQEANRGFFHPLGLALQLVSDPADPGRPANLLVCDYRDDAEGVNFVGGGLTEKAQRIKVIAETRRPARLAGLGYWQQPVGDPGFTVAERAQGFESKLDTER